ncbi:hypothetical protein N7466_009482 [Penicillium verhagenii]|uniref:uncharacterized protein n=1 Tax=Penicillium verhagenii TaxID=1562060 RepID=UPI0025451549|nr:uncharacterized protein N7466_009482 [Penicillium verhagenii]KAJ5921156.1 hypothetical protein N7466_009482 [Penicillium verhagenii]
MGSKLVEADLCGGVIQIDVGESKTPFDVHLELLCTCSPYFESQFQKRFEEAIPESFIHFPDDDPQVFAQVIMWMYRGSGALQVLENKKLDFLARLWILAEKLQMTDLENWMMAICHQRVKETPANFVGKETVSYIYAHALPESPLRRLVVDIWVRTATPEYFQKEKEGLPRQFLEEVCAELIGQRGATKLAPIQPPAPKSSSPASSRPLADHRDGSGPDRDPTETKRNAGQETMNSSKPKIQNPSEIRSNASEQTMNSSKPKIQNSTEVRRNASEDWIFSSKPKAQDPSEIRYNASEDRMNSRKLKIPHSRAKPKPRVLLPSASPELPQSPVDTQVLAESYQSECLGLVDVIKL